MKTVKETSKKWFKSKKFREAYDALEPEYALAAALIEARINQTPKTPPHCLSGNPA